MRVAEYLWDNFLGGSSRHRLRHRRRHQPHWMNLRYLNLQEGRKEFTYCSPQPPEVDSFDQRSHFHNMEDYAVLCVKSYV
ncbi:hypothetical protein ACMD2_25569 [Ananas comosus]|uniref:Uncharacterized protein n=1 Tax=Ananas comosus TaxID=4615 RepID=A0A199UQ33_ANACO|nr:hypothetical protein ACMD2_25569 [Ananas comosus]